MSNWNPLHHPYVSSWQLFLLCLVTLLLSLVCTPALAAQDLDYAGNKTCGQCHSEELKSYQEHSPKSTSWQSVSTMAPKLSQKELQKCYECHTTGYKQGGFVSRDKTPELANVGCEACHGPGLKHSKTANPQQIQRTPDIEDCLKCHSQERIRDFDFRPLRYAGAH